MKCLFACKGFIEEKEAILTNDFKSSLQLYNITDLLRIRDNIISLPEANKELLLKTLIDNFVNSNSRDVILELEQKLDDKQEELYAVEELIDFDDKKLVEKIKKLRLKTKRIQSLIDELTITNETLRNHNNKLFIELQGVRNATKSFGKNNLSRQGKRNRRW